MVAILLLRSKLSFSLPEDNDDSLRSRDNNSDGGITQRGEEGCSIIVQPLLGICCCYCCPVVDDKNTSSIHTIYVRLPSTLQAEYIIYGNLQKYMD